MKHKCINRREYTIRAIDWMKYNARNEFEQAQTVIRVSETHRWDYAIPENYTNYQDGFLYQDNKPYRAQPLLNYNGVTLYLRRIYDYTDRKDDEREKYLLFDRTGKKYIFIVEKEEYDGGNPSYFAFLPRVKKYAPTRAEQIRIRLEKIREKE